GGSSFSRERLQSAGISLRLVRSPVAPKITITQGEAVGLSAWFMSEPAFVRADARETSAPLSFRCARRIESASRKAASPRSLLHRERQSARRALRSAPAPERRIR